MVERRSPDKMLSKKFRLSGKDIELLKKKGKIIKSKNFSLLFDNIGDDNPTRYGFVVSSRISKLATTRNRVKRMLSLSTEKNINRIIPGCEIIFLSKKGIENITQEVLDEEIFDVFKYNKLI